MNPELFMILFYVYSFISSIVLLIAFVVISESRKRYKEAEKAADSLSLENTILRRMVYEKNEATVTVII